jgi:NAD(P)-dependent dehydrogenase (short-subunit alcohol dehydrogenase family)
MAPSPPIAVVTGASRGIGQAIALACVEAGYQVFGLSRSAPSTPGVTPVSFDAADPASVEAAAARVLEAGTPFLLVNNAGVALSAPLHKTSLEDHQRLLAVNLTAPFLLCRTLMPAMVKAGGGRVVNVASTAGLKGFRYTATYCASKHALIGLTRALAVEYAARNVTVNAVCPGWTDTDMLAASAANISKATGRTEAEARQVLADMNPMGRLVRPVDVAKLCLFLASDAGQTVTGAVWTMDGGESA